MNIEEQIWNYFKNKGFNDYSVAGMMGNIYKESGFLPNNLQTRGNQELNLTDQAYTNQVDNNVYKNFINDGYGYGLFQFTYYTLKEELLNTSKKNNKSISDINIQCDITYNQLIKYNIINELKNANSIEDASNLFLTKFERPKDQSEKVKQERIMYGKKYYNLYSKRGGSKMKYSESNAPLICMMTNSTCYKSTQPMVVKGVLWHSTGANNPSLKRYVQPSDNDPNKEMLIAKLGKNANRNDWNHQYVSAGVNAWIGKAADGSVLAVQALPWDYAPWGCGAGSKGSCNDGWIQFEICEDGLNDKIYFDKVYNEACELTAYLCKKFNINPKGSVNFNGVIVPTIICHKDSFNLKLGSNHGDVYHWFNKYGKTMDTVRNDVSNLLGAQPQQKNVVAGIKINDEGPQVQQLQQKLIKLGYKLPLYGADGIFGDETLAAVKAFQSDRQLQVTGIVDTNTMASIDNAINNLTAPKVEQPEVNNDELYRIRLDWNNSKTQIGAYKVLKYAITACDKIGGDYKVFNSKGEVVYPIKAQGPISAVQPDIPTPRPVVQPATTYSDVMTGGACKDERGQYKNGQAGDQTKAEVAIMKWRDCGWKYILRPKSEELAEKIAVACEKACNNDAIGYDQYQRNTIYIEAKKVGLDLSKVTTPCECDCSSLVSSCCVIAGLPESIFYSGSNMRTTSNLKIACDNTEQFNTLTSANYLKTKDYLKRGDILLADGHTEIVLSNGPKAGQIATINVTLTSYRIRVTANKLNVRVNPSSTAAIRTQISKGGVYTIVEEREGWGKLKSGSGWIDLSYTEKV